MTCSLQGFPSWSLQKFSPCPFVQKCKQLPSTGTFPSLWKGWLLSKAGYWHMQGMRWAEGTVPLSWSPHGSSTAMPRATQGSLSLLWERDAQPCSVWCYQYKAIPVSRISPFYRIKTIFPPVFYTLLLSTPTSPGGRWHGQLSCFWRWGLRPLYHQHPGVRTMSTIYSRMQSSKCQLYMNRKPRFEDFSLEPLKPKHVMVGCRFLSLAVIQNMLHWSDFSASK